MSHSVISKPAVLFVCLGNICRSPMAEGAFRHAAQQAGLDCIVDSAGTAAYHVGEAPDPRAIATAQAHGIDISGAVGRQLRVQDFHDFSHIFALDNANMQGIKACAPRHATAKIALLLDMVEGREGEAVPDPYYGSEEGFADCWDTISLAANVLVERLVNAGEAAKV